MNIKKAELKVTEDGFNEMPSRAVIETLLEPLKYGFRIVDTDKDYWKNEQDTIVFEIDGNELYRYGGATIADTIIATNHFINMTHPDEVHTEKRGSKVVYRMWWD